MTLALASVINYDRKLMLQIVASLGIITYNRNSFLIQATDEIVFHIYKLNITSISNFVLQNIFKVSSIVFLPQTYNI